MSTYLCYFGHSYASVCLSSAQIISLAMDVCGYHLIVCDFIIPWVWGTYTLLKPNECHCSYTFKDPHFLLLRPSLWLTRVSLLHDAYWYLNFSAIFIYMHVFLLVIGYVWTLQILFNITQSVKKKRIVFTTSRRSLTKAVWRGRIKCCRMGFSLATRIRDMTL